jgi:hypothetical protein
VLYTRDACLRRWRRHVDLAGPSPFDLQAGSSAPQRRCRTGRCTRAAAAQLIDALELTLLVARNDPRRHRRIAARWLLRYLEEDPEATIEEATLAASSLLALTGVGYLEAAQTLKAMAERATRRRRESGVA